MQSIATSWSARRRVEGGVGETCSLCLQIDCLIVVGGLVATYQNKIASVASVPSCLGTREYTSKYHPWLRKQLVRSLDPYIIILYTCVHIYIITLDGCISLKPEQFSM